MANIRLSATQIDALGALAHGELAYTVAGWSTSRSSIEYFHSTTIYVLERHGYCRTSGAGFRRVVKITDAGRQAQRQLVQQSGAEP